MPERDGLPQLFSQGHQRLVDDDGDVAGVRGDVRQLVDVESNVERVEDRAERRHSEIRLEVAKVVPAQRGHAVAAADTKLLQRGGESARAA